MLVLANKTASCLNVPIRGNKCAKRLKRSSRRKRATYFSSNYGNHGNSGNFPGLNACFSQHPSYCGYEDQTDKIIADGRIEPPLRKQSPLGCTGDRERSRGFPKTI